MLTDTDRHRRIDTRCVHILLHKREIAPERFRPVNLDIIEGKGHTRVGLGGVLVSRFHAERVLVSNHILNQLDGRVTFAFVVPFAVLGSHHNILQTVHIRLEFNFGIGACLPFAERYHLGLVSQHLEGQSRVSLRTGDTEVSVHVGCRTLAGGHHSLACCGLEIVDLHERQGLSCLCVDHHAGDTCSNRLLC